MYRKHYPVIFHYLNAKYASFCDTLEKLHTNFSHDNDQRAGTPFLRRQAERVKVVQPAEGKLQGHPIVTFQFLEWAYKKGGERLFTRASCDRTRGNSLNLEKVDLDQM